MSNPTSPDNSSEISSMDIVHQEFDLTQEPDVFADARLSAIFANNIVLMEDRIDLSKSEVEPKFFVEKLTKSFTNVSERFSQSNIQRDFFEEEAKKKTKITSISNQFSIEKKIPVVQQIAQHLTKGEKIVSVLGRQMAVPSVKTDALPSILSSLKTYNSMLLDNLEVLNTPGEPRINRDASQCNLDSTARKYSTKLTNNREREEVYRQLIVATMLEDILHRQETVFLQFLQRTALIDEKSSTGAFVRVDDHTINFIDRSNSMISDSAVCPTVNINYNLSLSQMRYLATYIFSGDPVVRTEAKIHVLSSVSPDIRHDVALHPGKVLLTSFGEHYLTRTEILHFMFSFSSVRHAGNTRCISCNILTAPRASSISHAFCPVSEWLVEHCNFEHKENVLIAPKLVYLRSGVANYARRLIQLDAQRRLHPYISRTQDEFKIIKLDAKGNTRVAAQSGSKPVRVTSMPSSSMHSTGSNPHYNLRK